jgi:hypothetical protein
MLNAPKSHDKLADPSCAALSESMSEVVDNNWENLDSCVHLVRLEQIEGSVEKRHRCCLAARFVKLGVPA